jgi:hypothetical protein
MVTCANRASAKKSVFDENCMKTKTDAKSFVWSYFGNLVGRANCSVNYNANVYCSQCFENKELKLNKGIVSRTNLAHHLRDAHSILFRR